MTGKQGNLMKYRFNDIEIDATHFVIKVRGKQQPIEPKVFDLLLYLLRNRDRLISRDELFEKVWHGRIVSDTSLSNHIKNIRKLVNDDAERQCVIKTVRSRGYQFICPVNEIKAEKQEPEPSRPKGFPQTLLFSLSNKKRLLTFLVLIGLVFLINWGASFYTDRDSRPYILVVPFSVSGDIPNHLSPFADQITREIIQSLRKISGLKVVPPPSSFAFKANKTRDFINERLPNIDYVLDGIVAVDKSGAIQINTELEHLNRGNVIWDGSYQLTLDKLNSFQLQEAVATAVSSSLKVLMHESEKAHLAELPTTSTDAYKLYVEGQYLFSKMTHEAMIKSIEYFSQAIALDAAFEAAYLAKSNAYRAIMTLYEKPKDVLPHVVTSTVELLKISPDSAIARSSLGLAYVHTWLWADAWKVLTEAKLRRQDIMLTELGFALYFSALGEVKLTKQSLAKADALDPLNEELAEWGAWSLMMLGELEDAILWGEEKIKLHPNKPSPKLSQAVALYINGNYQQSIKLAQKGVKLSNRTPLSLVFLAQSFAAMGDEQRALSLLTEANQSKAYVCPYESAIVYIQLEQLDRAFELLQEAVEYRSNCLVFIRNDPRLASVRGDSRYLALLDKVGLSDMAIKNYARG
ncbi:transcriptional regulator [Thalassotalea euphylliae]|uniref:Transcriptional regulator n=2 Tax=Thalassotalea euphylliae TaxID=1655234 RepID=A0A3E0UH32_9GAMM|nr:transcriptional regulator [Thalassotalea euphylliae]